MACPRCDGPLEEYILAGSEAVVCENCGYSGVPVEHAGAPTGADEPWAAALARADLVEPTVSAGSVPDPAEMEDGGVPCPACGRLFDSERGLAVHRGQVHDRD